MRIRILFTLVLFLSMSASAFPTVKTDVDFSRYFGDLDSAFIIYNLKADSLLVHNQKQCEKRFSPWATYDLVNTLIALETRNVRDETFILPWDGTEYPDSVWNRNHTLETAMRNSVDWYFQELARKMGAMRMESFMNRIEYGDGRIMGGIDRFWLGSTLKINTFEQVKFLSSLYNGELPFSRRTMDIVKNLITREKTDAYVLKGKEGSDGKGGFAWYVGWVEQGDNVYVFAANIKDKKGATGEAAREKSLAVLKGMGIL